MEILYYFIKNISILGITIITGVGLATLFVSKFCWKYVDKEIKIANGIHSLESESESESEPENEEEKFYNDDKEFLKDYYSFKYKFNKEFEKLEIKKLSENEKLCLKSSIFEIDTPKGKVNIFYDHENLEFKYYATTSLEFWMLQIITQAYALEYNCKEIIENVEKNLIDLDTKDKNMKNVNNKLSSVFLNTNSSKKYENRDKEYRDREYTDKEKLVDLFKKYGHLVKVNKFKYMGKVLSLEEENKKKEKEEFVNISYKDYLNLKKVN